MAPQSAASPKMTIAAHPMTTLFLLQNPFTRKNVDVCKKLELDPLRFDRDIRVLSKKKNIFRVFYFFDLQTKNAVNQRVFKIFQNFFFYMVSYYPLILYLI